MTISAYHEIYARRAAMQALTVVRLDGMSARVVATALPEYATRMCAVDVLHGLGTVRWLGAIDELCLTCASYHVGGWLASGRTSGTILLAVLL